MLVIQEKKRQERMLFSQQYEEDEKEHAKLAATAHRDKDHLVSVIAHVSIFISNVSEMFEVSL